MRRLTEKIRDGFAFSEILIAMLMFGVISLYLTQLLNASNQGTMLIYYQHIAEKLAEEPVDFFRGAGYRGVIACNQNKLSEYKADIWQPLAGDDELNADEKPAVVALFERKIILSPAVGENMNGYLVKVAVRPVKSVGSYLQKRLGEISCSALILEKR